MTGARRWAGRRLGLWAGHPCLDSGRRSGSGQGVRLEISTAALPHHMGLNSNTGMKRQGVGHVPVQQVSKGGPL